MKNLRISQLRIIDAVARHQSFSRAAAEVHLSLAAVSSAIAQVERQIGMALFERTTRSVRLTPLGNQYLPQIRDIVRTYDRFVQELSREVTDRRGRVALGCLTLLGVQIVPKALALVRKRHPLVEIELRDNAAQGVYEDVETGRTDLALASEYENRPGLSFTPLLKDEFVLICQRSHELAKRRTIKLSETYKYRFIALSRDTGVRRTLDRQLGPLEGLWSIAYEVSQLSAAIGLVSEGLGISIAPRLGLPPRLAQGIKVVEIRENRPLRMLGLLRRIDRPLSPAALAVAQAIQEVLSSA